MLTVKEHLSIGTHPSCATKEQFITWARVDRNGNVTHFCDDCTPAYESTMKSVGRCDKHADS